MPRQTLLGRSLFFVVFLACMEVSAAFAQALSDTQEQSLRNLSEELVALRSDIERLNGELTDITDQHRAQMAALAAQKGELEAAKRRETLRIRELEEDLAANKARAAEAGLATEALVPIAESAIASLKVQISEGFPFKRADRLSGVMALEDQLQTGALSPARVVSRLWGFYEDELRLSRENGLYAQTIELEGESVLADIAKLGVVAMYFETRDGRLGYATRDSNGWQFVEASGGGQRQQIKALFDALQKQIRVGLFELPNGSIELGDGT